MKDCPFCAESIQSNAVKCRYCHSEIRPAPTPIKVNNLGSPFDSWVIKGLLLSLAAIAYLSILFFRPTLAFLLALLVIWWLNYSEKRSIISRLRNFKQYKFRIILSIAAIGVSLLSVYLVNYPAPSLEVISDTDNQGQNTSYVLEVLTHDATYLIVNGQTITENDNGRFRTLVDLTTTQTTLDIQAANNVKTTKASVLIEREHTAEELAKQEEGLIRAEARRLELEEIQKKWEATEAGQICLRRSDWSKDDCQKIADGEYWVGMSTGMLKELRGAPNSANPSDYGNGISWQWCWWNESPSCFYDHNNDGLIDSYN